MRRLTPPRINKKAKTMLKYLFSIITGGLKTAKAFENAKRAKIRSNYEELLEDAKTCIRAAELRETGLLQSDEYCKELAEISIEFARRRGEVDEFYNIVPCEGD